MSETLTVWDVNAIKGAASALRKAARRLDKLDWALAGYLTYEVIALEDMLERHGIALEDPEDGEGQP